MNFIIVKPELSRAELIELMVQQFPEIKEDVLDEDYSDLIHLQIGYLADYANNKIGIARFDEVQRVFHFFEKVITKVDSHTENAFYVSFLEHLNMDGNSEKERMALKLLPKQFLAAYHGLRNHHLDSK